MLYLFWGLCALIVILLVSNKLRSGSFFSNDRQDTVVGAQRNNPNTGNSAHSVADTADSARKANESSRYAVVEGLGIAALILGGFSMLVAWIPLVGVIALPLELLGALLAVIGIIGGFRRVTTLKPFAGLVLCLVPILWQGALFGSLYYSVRDGVESALEQAQSQFNALSERQQAYVNQFVEIFDLQANNADNDQASVIFKISNTGSRAINSLTTRIDFLDDHGNTIYSTEVKPFSAGINGQSALRPGETWHAKSKFSVDDVPQSWVPGSIRVSVINIQFGQAL